MIRPDRCSSMGWPIEAIELPSTESHELASGDNPITLASATRAKYMFISGQSAGPCLSGQVWKKPSSGACGRSVASVRGHEL